MSQTGLPSPPPQPTPATEPEVQASPAAPVPPPPSDNTDENDISLHNVIAAITTATSAFQLNHSLKTFAPKDIREVILASFLPDGQDPLSVLDIQANTLGILYIL